jgi:F-type H+-transporting ATPase subunit delta
MAELATIARPYAEALFKASQADLEGAAAWLEPLAAIAGDPQLLQLAGNPNVRAQQLVDVITGVIRQPLAGPAMNFLRTVIDNDRLAALPEIARQFRALKNARSGSSDAVVYSAFPLDAGALGSVAPVLEKRFGRKLNFTVQEDPSLIGGVRVVVGDEVLDTSVKARLEQMKVALTA